MLRFQHVETDSPIWKGLSFPGRRAVIKPTSVRKWGRFSAPRNSRYSTVARTTAALGAGFSAEREIWSGLSPRMISRLRHAARALSGGSEVNGKASGCAIVASCADSVLVPEL